MSNDVQPRPNVRSFAFGDIDDEVGVGIEQNVKAEFDSEPAAAKAAELADEVAEWYYFGATGESAG